MAGFVTVNGLRKRYGDVWAVDDISFEIEEGKLLVLLGPSGCGKTTTLRCIGGLETAQAGEIIVDGKAVTSVSSGIFLQPEARGMGMVAQSYAIWPHMNVYENIAFPLRMRKESKEDIAERVKDALEVVRLGGLGDRNATDLSGGQQQRVALARAIVGRPKVLLFDEPLSNLDAKLREHMRYLLKEIQREINITAVYVTHDQAEAMGLGDELLVMNFGKIEQRGRAREIYCDPATRFVAEFIGVANMFEGTLVDTTSSEEGTVLVRLGEGNEGPVMKCLGASSTLDGRVVVLVRPEWFNLSVQKPQQAENVLTGTVHTAHYLGERAEMLVNTNLGEVRITAGGDEAFDEGTQVHLTIDATKAIALPAQ